MELMELMILYVQVELGKVKAFLEFHARTR